MAFNSQIKGYMTFGKSFSRGGAFPLEAHEIWYDYDALVAYAANTDPSKDPSYIGQKVTHVDLENNKVTHYSIEIDGSLKELGASLIGDENSIVINPNNTISLKGIDGLTFEQDILDEEGQPTGNKENVQFQPLMTKNGLIWVKPSKTTVEGLSSSIESLTVEVNNIKKAEEDNTKAIAALIGEDYNKTIRAIAAEETANIVAGADTKYDTLKEIADFIINDETGITAMANDIAALKTTVGDAGQGLVKAVADNTIAIAAIVQPNESTEISVAKDGKLGIKEMNVNKLVQTDGDVFIIDGGAAV